MRELLRQLEEEDHAFCRASFNEAMGKARACLAAKGITSKGIGAVSTRIGAKRHFTVEVMAAGKKLVWQGGADCAWAAKEKAVADWCGMKDDERGAD